jgi:hypothetical protein
MVAPGYASHLDVATLGTRDRTNHWVERLRAGLSLREFTLDD